MPHRFHHPLTEIKYGAFTIHDEHGVWNGDETLSVQITNTSEVAYREGVWNPGGGVIDAEIHTAITGMCIWGKHDCMFHFAPKGKGNPGAKRSLSNIKDRQDIRKRIEKGDPIDKLLVSNDPFGLYQTQMVAWQKEVVDRYNISKLYYSLPIEEYYVILAGLEGCIPHIVLCKLRETLQKHHAALLNYIQCAIPTKIEFINPLRDNPAMSVEESYAWPYKHLGIDLGIEEMEEIRIPYQAMQGGAKIPPILLGMLGYLSPYYEQRAQQAQSDIISDLGLGALPQQLNRISNVA